MLSHRELVHQMLSEPEVREQYEALAEEFALFDELVMARNAAGLTQAEVAKRMGTRIPAISRLEAGGGKNGHSPSIKTLRKYAESVGCRLEIKLVPR